MFSCTAKTSQEPFPLLKPQGATVIHKQPSLVEFQIQQSKQASLILSSLTNCNPGLINTNPVTRTLTTRFEKSFDNQFTQSFSIDKMCPLAINNKIIVTDGFEAKAETNIKVNFIYRGNEVLNLINKINVKINETSFFLNNNPVNISANGFSIFHLSKTQQIAFSTFLDDVCPNTNDVLLLNLKG